ncbi:hypothetical protein ASL14_25640 (plasmid) [Paenibacillus sp. IHB B 3084]|uniref:LytTR family transcriptional regulator DNA-binding domain-containing protein n=1 Tax=Paenibacillus sp. IHB B 3084 TaxID=867076 RepID=UPI00072210B2|nr:LytTR family transcriptional regulator DNA-binding domain-containing protein [Paenibacillus sp. IHB B 3084]ALP39274.1 hypothetical protein ASL14_25640 [Paenibacillus sp. IHB B 3084]
MLNLTVATDPEAISGGENIPVNKVLYISRGRKRNQIMVHTFDKIFYMTGTLKYWETFLNNSGFKFLNVDRGKTLNVEKVKIVNGIFKDAYFESEIAKLSQRCPIAYHRYNEVIKELGIMNPNIIFTGAATT